MLTGSVASSLHGEPRATLDIDIVVDPTEPSIARLVTQLETHDYYVDLAAAREALAEGGQFNAIHRPSGWKVDFIVRKRAPFADSEFARRQRVDLLGLRADVATAEDTIVAKLEWAQAGESERQLRDVAGILRVSGDGLDRDYISRWVRQLGLVELWERASSIAE